MQEIRHRASEPRLLPASRRARGTGAPVAPPAPRRPSARAGWVGARGVPAAPRRAIAGALWLSGSLLLGGLLGWVSRGRALVRAEQERARAEARERRYRAGAGA